MHSTSSPGARCAESRCMRLSTRVSSPSSSQRSVQRRKVRSHPPASGSHRAPRPRPGPSRPGPARSPRPPVRLFLRGPPHLPDAVDLFTPRPADHLRHSCPCHGAPARCPSDRTTRVLPVKPVRVLVRGPPHLPDAASLFTPRPANRLRHSCPCHGAPARCPSDRTTRVLPVKPVRVLVRGPPHLPDAASLFTPRPANHLRCSYPGHGAPARCPSDRTTRVPPHRTDCSLPTKPSMGIDTPSELGILRAGTGCTDLRPAPQLGSCSANPGTERGLAPERKPPWTHRLDSPRYPPPSRRGRWPSPTPRPHGLARSPGALAHRCSLTVGPPLGSERASRSRPSSSGADTPRPGRRRRWHGLARSPGALAHRYSLTVGSPPGSERASRRAGRLRAAPTRPGRGAAGAGTGSRGVRGLSLTVARSPLAHRWVRSGPHGAGRLRAAPTHLGRRAADILRPERRAPAS